MDTQSQEVAVGTPAADIVIDVDLVRNLLSEQYSDLAQLPIRPGEVGFDNAIFRLGDELCVRLPRRQVAAPLIEHEQAWLPLLAEQLAIAIPVPLRIGLPSPIYPWRWSVLPWLPGQAADQAAPHPNQAERFAWFLKSLHQPAPANAPRNPLRGVPLSQRAESVEARMRRLEMRTSLITKAVKQVWQIALKAPASSQPRWLHGDLHPRNVLVQNGIITGVIDWGDITAGDVATDLAAIWMLFPNRQARQRALAAYGHGAIATLQRAKGWAVFFGVVLLDTGLVDHPRHRRMGEQILRCLAQDDESLLS